MRRKLIRQGKGGYTIYLPHAWVEERGLSYGEDVEMEDAEGALVIRAAPKGRRSITLQMRDKTPYGIRSTLSHLYRVGYDVIQIQEVDQPTLTIIRDIVATIMLGFEVTDVQGSACTLENVSEPTDEKHDTILRRIFLINKECMSILLADAKAAKYPSMEQIHQLRQQIDKYIIFCLRLLTRGMHTQDMLFEWEMLKHLLYTQHGIYYLYMYLEKNKPKLPQSTIDVIQTLPGYYDIAYEAYWKRDKTLIDDTRKLKHEYHFGVIIKLLEKSKGPNTIALSYLREIYRIIQLSRSSVLSMIYAHQ